MQKTLYYFRNLLSSAAIHAAVILIGVILFSNPPLPRTPPQSPSPIEIELEKTATPRGATPKKSARGSTQSSPDLRPDFVRDGSLFSLQPKPSRQGVPGNKEGKGVKNPDAHELLVTESKVVHIFDLLAARINRRLDYPSILAENGIQGIATLDLYFDSDGNVNESRSRFFGSNRSVRGLLVQASRLGIVEWFTSDAIRLKKEQFRNQHFRAEFLILFGGDPEIGGELKKEMSSNYTFTRRNRKTLDCFKGNQQAINTDLACLAARMYGAARSKVDSEYRLRFQALRERLEHYDEIGMNGIGNEIRSRT